MKDIEDQRTTIIRREQREFGQMLISCICVSLTLCLFAYIIAFTCVLLIVSDTNESPRKYLNLSST